MRNWNFHAITLASSGSFSFLQYLWGIETLILLLLKCQFVLCFYSTYEEWNAAFLSVDSPRFHRFYSTYEELKLTNQTEYNNLKELFLQYLWGIETRFNPCTAISRSGFYSTYEELKHCRLLILAIFVLFVLQYLWGWNRKVACLFRTWPMVFTVPMRNWNAKYMDFRLMRFIVFTVPMRNWNLACFFLLIPFALVFTVPMRNWNQG